MDELEKLKTALARFPSLFDLEADLVKHNSKQNIDAIINKILKEEDEHLCDTEKVRAMNLLSFLYFCVDNLSLSYYYNDQAVRFDDSNIIARSNKAWIRLKKERDLYDVRQIVETLETLQKCELAVVTADAEKAYAYSRFGIRLHQKAIEGFWNVVKKAKTMHNSMKGSSDQNQVQLRTNILRENICIWSFRLALTERRRLNIHSIHDPETISYSQEKHQEVLKLFQDVANSSGSSSSKCIQTYRARALVEIGEISHTAHNNRILFPNGLADIFPGIQEYALRPIEYFESALTVCSHDEFVLQKCGRHFRYVKDLERSIALLKAALKVKETSFAHHHLALSLKRDLEQRNRRKEQGNIPTEHGNIRMEHGNTRMEQGNIRMEHGNRRMEQGNIPMEQGSIPMEQRNTRMEQGNGRMEQGNRHIEQGNIRKEQGSIRTEQGNKYTEQENRRTEQRHSRGHVRNLFTTGNQNTMARQTSSQIGVQTNYQTSFRASKGTKGIDADRSGHIDDQLSSSQSFDSGMFSMDMSTGFQAQGTVSEMHLLEEKTMGLQINDDPATGGYKTVVENLGLPCHNRHVDESRGLNNKFKRSISEPQHIRSSIGRGVGRGYSRSWSEESGTNYNQRRIMRLIKSPNKIDPLDVGTDQTTIEAIVSHLDKAVQLSPTNAAAQYDKGILYRQIGKHQEALNIFRGLIKNKENSCSIIQLANSYEQAAFCMQNLADSGCVAEARVLEDDIRCYLKRSIELSCMLVAKIPSLKDCWLGPLTLREFIQTKPKTKRSLSDLFFLHRKMQNYDEAVTVLQELKSLSLEESERVDILSKLVKVHSEYQRYDDAILALDLIRCLPDGYDKINEELYISVHVEGGMEALKKGEKEMARLRFKNALDFSVYKNRGHANTEGDSSAEKSDFDIFVLCEKSMEGKWRVLVELLNETGIVVTLNTDDVLPALTELSGIASIIESSKNFIFALDSPTTSTSDHVKMYAGMIHGVLMGRSYGHRLVVSDGANTCVPTILKGIPRIDLSLEKLGVSEKWARDYFHENMKALLTRLALPSVEVAQ